MNLPSSVFSACDFFSQYPAVLRPHRAALSQERLCVLDCWVTFHGRLPLSPKKHNIQAVGCKRRNFGRSTAACCVFTAILRIAATLVYFLKASRPGAALSARSEATGFGCTQVSKKSCRMRDSWGHTRGNAGTEMWLSAISERRGVQSWLWSSMSAEIPSRPSDAAASLTVGLRGKKENDSVNVLEKLRQKWSILTAVWDHHLNNWLLQNVQIVIIH